MTSAGKTSSEWKEEYAAIRGQCLDCTDAFERLGIRHPPADGDFHTLAGFALWRLGRIPEVGEAFEWENWRFEVSRMDSRRIAQIAVRRLDDHPAGD